MNRSDKSPFSRTPLLNTLLLPVEAQVRAIISPQRRQQSARSITMLAVAGAMAGAIGLASVQVKAGQAATAERAEVARAQAALDAALETQSRTEAGQSSAREAFPQAQKSARSEDAAALRRKLDILEELLVRNQEENAQLRQKLKTLMAQQKNALPKNKIMEQEAQSKAITVDKIMEQEAQRRAAEAARAAQEISQARVKASEAMMNEMKQQLLLQQNRLKQAEELSRKGLATSQEADRLRAELDAARAQIEAAQAQLRAAQAEQKSTQQEQGGAKLRLEIAEQQARLQQAKATLALVKARHDAGSAGDAEVQEAEANVSSIAVTIDQLQLKLNRAGGR